MPPTEIVRTGIIAAQFAIEIDGIQLGSFRKVTGLEVEFEHKANRSLNEKGQTIFAWTRGNMKEPPAIVLERVIDSTTKLWEWIEHVIKGDMKAATKNGSIVAQDTQINEIARWNFFNGWPTKWSGADFDASSSDIAVEKIEIVHERLERHK